MVGLKVTSTGRPFESLMVQGKSSSQPKGSVKSTRPWADNPGSIGWERKHTVRDLHREVDHAPLYNKSSCFVSECEKQYSIHTACPVSTKVGCIAKLLAGLV